MVYPLPARSWRKMFDLKNSTEVFPRNTPVLLLELMSKIQFGVGTGVGRFPLLPESKGSNYEQEPQVCHLNFRGFFNEKEMV